MTESIPQNSRESHDAASGHQLVWPRVKFEVMPIAATQDQGRRATRGQVALAGSRMTGHGDSAAHSPLFAPCECRHDESDHTVSRNCNVAGCSCRWYQEIEGDALDALALREKCEEVVRVEA